MDPGGHRQQRDGHRGDGGRLHAGGGRPGHDDQGKGELHRQQWIRRDAHQRRDGGRLGGGGRRRGPRGLEPQAHRRGRRHQVPAAVPLLDDERNGSSTDIATYNTFVQTRAAAGHADIRTYSAGFRAVGCTAAVDARDNTATTYTTTDKGVPIYWLNGAKAADQYEDFYDGSWDDEANDKNESGTDAHDTSVSTNYPFTGCNHDGTESFTGSTSRALGATSCALRRSQLLRERRRPPPPRD